MILEKLCQFQSNKSRDSHIYYNQDLKTQWPSKEKERERKKKKPTKDHVEIVEVLKAFCDLTLSLSSSSPFLGKQNHLFDPHTPLIDYKQKEVGNGSRTHFPPLQS